MKERTIERWNFYRHTIKGVRYDSKRIPGRGDIGALPLESTC